MEKPRGSATKGACLFGGCGRAKAYSGNRYFLEQNIVIAFEVVAQESIDSTQKKLIYD